MHLKWSQKADRYVERTEILMSVFVCLNVNGLKRQVYWYWIYQKYTKVLVSVFVSTWFQKAILSNILRFSSPCSPFLWHLNALKRQVYWIELCSHHRPYVSTWTARQEHATYRCFYSFVCRGCLLESLSIPPRAAPGVNRYPLSLNCDTDPQNLPV